MIVCRFEGGDGIFEENVKEKKREKREKKKKRKYEKSVIKK